MRDVALSAAVWAEAVARSIPAILVVVAGVLLARLVPRHRWRTILTVAIGVIAAGIYLGATALQLPGVVPFIVGPAIFLVLSAVRVLRLPSLSFLVTYSCYLVYLVGLNL